MPITLKQAVLGDIDREFRVTRTLLARVPDEHLSWKPHDKSMSVAALCQHLNNLFFWYRATAQHDELDLAATPPSPPPPEAIADFLTAFDAHVKDVRAVLDALSEDDLNRTWTLRHGAHQVFAIPKAEVLRIWCTNHMIHHRGQLSVYLRLLDIPLPPMYGPTADER